MLTGRARCDEFVGEPAAAAFVKFFNGNKDDEDCIRTQNGDGFQNGKAGGFVVA
jgi:hypothetical protein